MHARWMVGCVIVIVTRCAAFENSAMRERKRALRDAVSEIKVAVGSYSREEIQCAACEAVSRSLQDVMSSGRHKAGAVERIAVLYEACEGIETMLPSALPPMEEGGPQPLHFWKADDKDMEKLKTVDVTAIGLKQYCNTLVEEFEDAIVGEMASAKEFPSAMANAMAGMSRYSMVQALCVRATPSCSEESLNRITQHRMAMGMKNSATRESMERLIEKMGKEPPKAAKAPKAPKASKARTPRETTPEAAEPPKGLFKLVESLRALVAQSTMAVLVSGFTVTTTAVYVGGMVARVW